MSGGRARTSTTHGLRDGLEGLGGVLRLLLEEAILAEASQDAGRLVALLVERRRPEGFRPELVREPVDGLAELIERLPGLVEALLARGLGLVPADGVGHGLVKAMACLGDP